MNCQEEGRVETFMSTADTLEEWLEDAETDPDLADCIMEYVRGRGGKTMEEVCYELRTRRFD